jgi:hypothetical protein
MPRRPVEGECPAPVVTDEHDVVQADGVEPRAEIPGAVGESVVDVGLSD